jgi:putative SOS response-associated peptidase YedK
MCAQYRIKAKIKELEFYFSVTVEDVIDWIDHMVPHGLAPVVTKGSVRLMRFSLLPSWSKEPKVKFATHNARLETVAEKPTWKRPFLSNHCIVPMSSFIEPIYEGRLAGNMVEFQSSALMCAAGIYDSWTDRNTGEVIESFAVITAEPCDYVREIGHDRQPVFLNREDALAWTNLEGGAKQFTSFLTERAVVPQLTAEIERPLKSGWEKRK